MECESNYASSFLHYLSDFVANIRPDDPLPVRAPSYKVTENEIDGQILDIVHHYLNIRECPPYVREYVGHRVWTAIRNPGVNGDGEDQVDSANETNHTYDSMKLIQEVTSKANTVIREMQATLTAEQVNQLPRYHPISHFAIKNTRRKMEDRHVIIHDLNTLYGMEYEAPHAYYGVFDGHAGTDAAVYAAAHLHQYMIQNPQYEVDPVAALKHAFYITDTNFIKKANKERLKGGTTAVVALVREKRLVVAWLGDSQALLVRRRNPVRMVEPHKPELPNERERVEEMGGCVINIQGTWRVLGQLAVSRAIGDVEYKPFVTAECDIKSLEIEGDEDFLILACDGLWDTLTPEAAVNVVYAYLTRNDGDTDGVGRCLVEAARSQGSEDNITAVVVFLRPVATLMEEEAQRVAQGLVPEPVPESMVSMDTTPSSINAIFSPPINQFSSPFTPPIYDPFEQADAKPTPPVAPTTLTYKELDEPMEGSEAPRTHDSDSDEGVMVEGADGANFNPHDAPTPTAEEVDAALAELDSIPDGVCESGDVDEEEEEEEEWSYFRMEPQTHQAQQGEDVLVGAGPAVAKDDGAEQDVKEEQQPVLDTPDILHASMDTEKPCDLMQMSMDKIPDLMDGNLEPSSPKGSVSPRGPGSPRSVEGFVTSVELNTPEESFASNFAINQNADMVNTEQNSGPFSVYVSSSPEPASLDPVESADPVVEPAEQVEPVNELSNGQLEESAASQKEVESPVEIVHAQSLVEVVAPPSPVEITGPGMQFTDTPVEPSDITFVPDNAVEPVVQVPEPVYVDEVTPVSEADLLNDVSAAKESMITEPVSIEPATSPVVESAVATELESTPAPIEPTPIEPTPIIDQTPEIEPTPEIIENTKETEILEPTPEPVENSSTTVEATVISPEPVVVPAEVAPVKAEPAVEVKPTPEKKTSATKSPLKTTRTPVAGAKTAARTPAKATPEKKTTTARPTPGRAVPARPTAAKATEKPASTKPVATVTARPRPSKPAETSKPATTKTTVSTKPATTRPVPSRVTTTSTTKTTARSTGTTLAAKKPAEKTTITARTATTAKEPAKPAVSKTGPTRPTPTARTTTTTARRPLTTASKPADKTDGAKMVNGTTRPASSTGAARKPLSTATTRPTSARPGAEKDTKNTTNRILSTRPTTTARTATATGTTRTTATKTSTTMRSTATAESKTTTAAKSRTTATRTTATRTTGVATKTGVTKTKTTTSKVAAVKAEKTEAAAEVIVNGENKIADEETSVEVVEKCVVEDGEAIAEKVISESTEVVTSEQVMTMENSEIIVNGNH